VRQARQLCAARAASFGPQSERIVAWTSAGSGGGGALVRAGAVGRSGGGEWRAGRWVSEKRWLQSAGGACSVGAAADAGLLVARGHGRGVWKPGKSASSPSSADAIAAAA
jgi:hypothetical protein